LCRSLSGERLFYARSKKVVLFQPFVIDPLDVPNGVDGPVILIIRVALVIALIVRLHCPKDVTARPLLADSVSLRVPPAVGLWACCRGIFTFLAYLLVVLKRYNPMANSMWWTVSTILR